MNRTTTWAGIGTDFVQGKTQTINGVPEEMIFDVEKKPMGFITNDGNFQIVKGTSTVVDQFGHAYGPVSDNYGIVNNVDALSVIEYIDGFETKKL